MIKICLIVIVIMIGIFFCSLFSYGATGGVKDNNNGNIGDILTHSGDIKNKKNDIGTWVNPKTLSFKDKWSRTQIKNQANKIANNEDRLNNQDGRINDLEETQVNITPEIILLQGRRHKIGIYGKYDTLHNKIPEVGLRISIALDDSWEAKEIDKINTKFKELETKLNRYKIETEVVQTSDSSFRIQIKDKDDANKFLNNIK